MYKLSVTINQNADLNYFNDWMRENYADNYSGSSEGDMLNLYFESEPDDGDKTSIDSFYQAITENDSLDTYKALKYEEIDNRTDDIVSNGYVYQTKNFSLSSNAQINILALDNSRNDPVMIYPIKYNTINDMDSYDVVDADDLHAMYLTALATKKSIVDSGTVIKNQVRSCATRAEVDAIIDNR